MDEKTRLIGKALGEIKRCGKLLKYDNLVRYMYRPVDPAGLAVTRFFFGLLMTLDITEERGGADVDLKWGNPQTCHFPLFTFMKPPSFPYMSILYAVMWLGAVGITLGYKFRTSLFMFGIPYWYLFLLDKSFWNNHSYLYGIVTILLAGSSANHYFSVDAVFDSKLRNVQVPHWNYFILKFQFFLLYFFAGLKKTDTEWLEGYSMSNIGDHWVFLPFKIVLSTEQIDYFIVHWFGFLLDLTIGFWMLMELSRPIAMVFCSMFHLMNSRLFSIGMFPYVCLATLPLFCKEDWPKRIMRLFSLNYSHALPNTDCIYELEKDQSKTEHGTTKKSRLKQKFVVGFLMMHCVLQMFLPYSHFITKGYNNWTNGLYGYSWDMMVHSWNTVLVVVKVVDNESGREHFIDPQAWTLNERWSKHADMCVQYAQCVKYNLEHNPQENESALSGNISVYIDVWCSLNKRFQQRMYDPNYDLIRADWSPFRPVEWLMPVLAEYSDLRRKMNEITEHVYSWSNDSEVLFVADFPGLYLENFINEDLYNISLTVLEGEVIYEIDDEETRQSNGIRLMKGDNVPVFEGTYHRIHAIGSTPSCYMYNFVQQKKHDEDDISKEKSTYSPFPFVEDIPKRMGNFAKMMGHVFNSVSHIAFGSPLSIRNRTIKNY